MSLVFSSRADFRIGNSEFKDQRSEAHLGDRGVEGERVQQDGVVEGRDEVVHLDIIQLFFYLTITTFRKIAVMETIANIVQS